MVVAGLAGLQVLGLASVAVLVVLLASLLLKGRGSKAPPAAARASANGRLANGAAHSPAEPSKPRCTILFGTQTGTAERFAKNLRSQLESTYGAHTAFEVVDVENYDVPARLPQERLVLLLMATYGDGEPTDSAAEFYEWLSGDHGEEEPLKGVSFAVFGLGNRQYEHFCAMGKKVHKLMAALGGSPVMAHGEGDDDRDIDADFDGWSAQLFAALGRSKLLQANAKGEGGGNLGAESVDAYGVEELDARSLPRGTLDALPSGGSGTAHGSPLLGTVAVVRELHSQSSDRSCVHVEVDVSGSGLAYEAGDHVGVFPENSEGVVEEAAAALGLPLGFTFRLTGSGHATHELPAPFAGPVTLRCALARYADLLSAPSKAALSALAAFASDPAQAARLRELASIEGREEYHTYVVAGKRSLLQVMRDFPSARPSLGAFFASVAPRLQPRYYSISSSPAAHPTSIHITCAVVREEMPGGRLHEGAPAPPQRRGRRPSSSAAAGLLPSGAAPACGAGVPTPAAPSPAGVASTWLARLRKGGRVPLFVRRSAFKLPADPATPVVMVGPGTGLAPFRGFLQERLALAKRGTALGPAHLFFGCRRRDADFIYAAELEGAVAGGGLSQLHVAFSREGPSKDYVQHHMARHGGEIWGLLGPARRGHLYVCGDAGAMAKDVHRALHDIVQAATNCSGAAAEAAVKELSDSGRYQKDVW